MANLLASLGLRVWLDEGEIHLGDSLRTKLDTGLGQSRFGVVIISAQFFSKRWTKSELDGLFAKEETGKKVILPIWHNVKFDEIYIHSPILAGRVAVSTHEGLTIVARKIAAAIENAEPKVRPGLPIFAGRLTKTLFLHCRKERFWLVMPLSQMVVKTLSSACHQLLFANSIGTHLWRSEWR